MYLNSLIDPLDVNSIAFLSQTFKSSWLLWRSQVLGYLMWDTNPLLLQEKVQTYGVPHQGWGFWWDHVSASPTHLSVVVLSFVAEEQFSYFQFFFRGYCSTCNYRFGVPVGGGKFRIFLCQHLPIPPPTLMTRFVNHKSYWDNWDSSKNWD